MPETRRETAHPAGPIPASLRFESDTLSFKLGGRGQIAGVFYGYEEIPERWKNKLAKKTIIQSMAEELLKLAWSPD